MKKLLPLLCLGFLSSAAIAQEQKPPEPAVALSLAIFPGFGAGHFYSRDPMGAFFTIGEGIATGIMVYQIHEGLPYRTRHLYIGSVIANGVFRVAEMWTAPIVAAQARDALAPKRVALGCPPSLPSLPSFKQAAKDIPRETAFSVYASIGREEDAGFEAAIETVSLLLSEGLLPSVIHKKAVSYLLLHPESGVAAGIVAAFEEE